MSNLKALKWTQKNLNPLAELELTAYSALHEYEITEPKQGKFELKKTRLSRPDKKSEFLPYFDTVTEAQDWAWAHYQRSMQPYVVPSHAYTMLSKSKPNADGHYLTLKKGFTYEMGNPNDLVPHVGFWNGGRGCFDEDHNNMLFVAWMPIPEFKQGE